MVNIVFEIQMDSGSKTTLGEVRLEISKAPRRLAVFQKREDESLKEESGIQDGDKDMEQKHIQAKKWPLLNHSQESKRNKTYASGPSTERFSKAGNILTITVSLGISICSHVHDARTIPVSST